MKYKVLRDGVVIADGLTEPRFEDFDADPNKNHVYDVVVYETFDVFRDGVLIADDITAPEAQVVEEPKPEPKAAPTPAPRRRGKRRRR